MRAVFFGSRAACRLPGRVQLFVMIALIFMGGLAGRCSGARNSNWIGGQGLWTDPNGWDPAVVPNDGTPPLSLYSVVIGATGTPPNAAVTLPSQGSPFTIYSLDIRSAGSLSLQTGSSLTVKEIPLSLPISNAGTINLATGSTFLATPNTTITGGGTINLSSGAMFSGINSDAVDAWQPDADRRRVAQPELSPGSSARQSFPAETPQAA
jgi:hypothetical protein